MWTRSRNWTILTTTLIFVAVVLNGCLEGDHSNDGSNTDINSSELEGTLIYRTLNDDVQQFDFSSETLVHYEAINGESQIMGVIESEHSLIHMDDDFKGSTNGGVDFISLFRVFSRNGQVVDQFEVKGNYILNREIRVSPDGSTIGVVMNPESMNFKHNLVLLNRQGGQLYAYPKDDGSLIAAFNWGKNNNLFVAEYDSDIAGGNPYSAIYVVDFNTGGEKKLIRRFEGSKLDQSMSVSPDGQTIMFNIMPSNRGYGFGELDLYVMNTNGSNLKVFVDGEEDLHGAFSPDGQHAIVSYEVYSASVAAICFSELFVVDASKDNLKIARGKNNPHAFSLHEKYRHIAEEKDEEWLFCAQSRVPPIWTSW